MTDAHIKGAEMKAEIKADPGNALNFRFYGNYGSKREDCMMT